VYHAWSIPCRRRRRRSPRACLWNLSTVR
jgi:hypothetical protein